MFLNKFKKLFGDENARALKSAHILMQKSNSLEDEIKALPDEQLKAKTAEFKERLGQGETLDDIATEAFAVVREVSVRTTGMRPFDVQLLGGTVLNNGDITEMRTGEGKTLVATLPIYLNALTGKGVHLITVNDYLSKLHAALMGQIYAFLGLSVGVINHEASFLYKKTQQDGELDRSRDEEGTYKIEDELLEPCTRREAYEADITYGTNSEFGFDYLRDNLSYDKAELRQRGHNFAIIDEVDSILIDEARTPLIISAAASDADDFYTKFSNIARTLHKDTDYTVDEKQRAIQLTNAGISRAEEALGVENIYTDKGIKYVHHLETAVRAKALFENNTHYVVRDGEVIIVDEFTGRMQPGRRWSEGLHQAIEAKEGVEIQKESRTFASVTYQNYFRLYDKLSGMTGTAVTSSEEFFKVYGLSTVAIPTNKEVQRKDKDDLIFQTEKGKFTAIARKVKKLNENGQPILIGTASVEKNELLGSYLKREGIKHEMLNAKNHEREGEIIAEAGLKGAVTVATNMAGRGVDIKLGGAQANNQEYEEVKQLGGLFVLGTERHEARRTDNQLRGRSGRQGDPGETQFFVSLEDNLMRIFASDMIKNMMGRFGIAEDEPIENKMITRSLESAQNKIEGFHFDARKQVLSYDDILNRQRKSIYSRRRNILAGDDTVLSEELSTIFGDDQEIQEVIEKKKQEIGEEQFSVAIRRVLLQTLDMLWVEHLETMDYLRSSVGLRAYGQRDPLIEYKKEGLRMFKDLELSYAENIAKLLPRMEAQMFTGVERTNKVETHPNPAQLRSNIAKESERIGSESAGNTAPIKNVNAIGRNSPCPCGSGKKYKKCGLAGSPDHKI